MIVVGIDPGKNGGICIMRADGKPKVRKVPESLAELTDLLWELDAVAAFEKQDLAFFLEKVGASVGRNGRKQGVASTAKFARGAGQLEGVLESIQHAGSKRSTWQLVAPQKWQKAMNCMTGGNKNVSKQRAVEMFPNEKITHWKADAMLIAAYGLELLGAEST